MPGTAGVCSRRVGVVVRDPEHGSATSPLNRRFFLSEPLAETKASGALGANEEYGLLCSLLRALVERYGGSIQKAWARTWNFQARPVDCWMTVQAYGACGTCGVRGRAQGGAHR